MHGALTLHYVTVEKCDEVVRFNSAVEELADIYEKTADVLYLLPIVL